MANILCIETGSDLCSVGLASNGETLALRESDGERDHAGNIGTFTDEILRANDMHPDDLDAVAVSMGPGSYTGLRIGVSFAKGLCYGLGIPLIGVGSLSSLVEVARENYEAGILDVDNWTTAILAPMLDARRMEVYRQLFDTAGNPLSKVDAAIITPDTYLDLRTQAAAGGAELLIFGSGADKCKDILTGSKLIEVLPSARGLARPAQKAFDQKNFENIAYFEPMYLKDFIITKSKRNPLGCPTK